MSTVLKSPEDVRTGPRLPDVHLPHVDWKALNPFAPAEQAAPAAQVEEAPPTEEALAEDAATESDAVAEAATEGEEAQS